MINFSKALKSIFFTIIFLFSTNSLASKNLPHHHKVGNLTIEDIIQTNENIANSTSSKFVNKSIPGTIIEIKGKKFEIRFFIFEDTTNILEENTKFKDYIKQNNLLKLETIITSPVEGIVFESLSSRSTKLEDKVYFGIGLRIID